MIGFASKAIRASLVSAATTNRAVTTCGKWDSVLCWTGTTASACATTFMSGMSPMCKSCQSPGADSPNARPQPDGGLHGQPLFLTKTPPPWNQAQAEFREREVEKLPLGSSEQPGVHAVAEPALVHGQEYLCVLEHSAAFAREQLHSLTTSLTKVLPSWRRLSSRLRKKS